MPPARRSAVPACPRFRSAPPPPASPPPPPQKSSARHFRHRVPQAPHHAFSPPKTPVPTRQELRFVERVRCRRSFPLALPPPCAMASSVSSSFPALPRSFLTCAAWSFLRERLTPRPPAAKSHHRLFFKQTLFDIKKSNLSAAKKGKGINPSSILWACPP